VPKKQGLVEKRGKYRLPQKHEKVKLIRHVWIPARLGFALVIGFLVIALILIVPHLH